MSPKLLHYPKTTYGPVESLRLILSYLLQGLAVLSLAVMAYMIAYGHPYQWLGHALKYKNLKPFFSMFIIFSIAASAAHPSGGMKGLSDLTLRLRKWTSHRAAFPALVSFAAILFTWQQITEYFALEINFIPFSFYHYMFHYYFQGKIHFTHLLHTWYHINNILIPFAPIWYIWKSPFFLVAIYGTLAALAMIPLYQIARERFQDSAAAFFVTFLYANYRYLQNVLQMNFSPEIFYPLFIFASVYAAMRARWGLYYLWLALGLTVKEDAFIYFSGVGALVLFLKPAEGSRRSSYILNGILTAVLSAAYFLFISKVFCPLIGSDIFSRDIENYAGHGRSTRELILSFIKNIPDVFFGSKAKIATYINLNSRLLFLPLFTPAALLIFVPIFPLFFHHTGMDTDFVDLHFHYAAAVVPFVFLAFVFGYSNIYNLLKGRAREPFLWVSLLVLLFANGGHFTTEHITREDLESIRWAKSIPQSANLVTHGHLMPYIGTREYNYYFAAPWDNPEHPVHNAYINADYYLFDKNVNPYPMTWDDVQAKIDQLKQDPRYRLVRSDTNRVLFHKEGSA